MSEQGKKHSCPQCGLKFTASVIQDGDNERLELEYDGPADRISDEDRIAARIDELRKQWREEYDAERNSARPTEKESIDFIL